MLVCVKGAAALPSLIPSCGRPRATGLQDWRMGAWKGISSLPPFVDIWALHSSELHPALYMGLPTLCFRSQQATPPTLKELGFEYRGTNGSR